MSLKKFIKSEAAIYVLLGLIWIITVTLVNPVGEFPLNDDWAYARAVNVLLTSGKIAITSWGAMTLIAQVLWGALFCLPFGFSFTALRISTLVLGFAGIIAAYLLLKEIKTPKWIRFFLALVILSNPIYFELSNTYMSDVPFFSVSMFSFLFFFREIRDDNFSAVLAGTILGIIATLIRQLGIVIPISFGIAYLYKNGLKQKTFFKALMPALFTVSILILYHFWLKSSSELMRGYLNKNDALFNLWFLIFDMKFDTNAIKKAMVALIYLGLFLFPVLILSIRSIRQSFSHKGRRNSLIISLMLFLSISFILIYQHRLMPLGKNIIYNFGLGPVTLSDITILNLPHMYKASVLTWIIITACGILGGIIIINLVYLLIKKIFLKQQEGNVNGNKWSIIFIASVCILYSIPLSIGFFDRYLIFYIPLSIILVVSVPKINLNRIISFTISSLIIVIFLIFSITATHDYLSWNRARWQALNYLTKELKISYKDIDGGFEFNGWYGYDQNYKKTTDKSWWWVINDEYRITFGMVPNYSTFRIFTYPSWVQMKTNDIYILKKLN